PACPVKQPPLPARTAHRADQRSGPAPPARHAGRQTTPPGAAGPGAVRSAAAPRTARSISVRQSDVVDSAVVMVADIEPSPPVSRPLRPTCRRGHLRRAAASLCPRHNGFLPRTVPAFFIESPLEIDPNGFGHPSLALAARSVI